VYTSKGEEYTRSLYKGQSVALTRDYQQLADWVAHGNYPIGLAITSQYFAAYKDSIPIKLINLSGIKVDVTGAFGLMGLWNRAPHPNAAKVFANWIASKEGMALFGQIDGQAPVRNDVNPSAWLSADEIPQPGVAYFDSYAYDFVMVDRAKLRDYFASLAG